jgi:hypothetical protein
MRNQEMGLGCNFLPAHGVREHSTGLVRALVSLHELFGRTLEKSASRLWRRGLSTHASSVAQHPTDLLCCPSVSMVGGTGAVSPSAIQRIDARWILRGAQPGASAAAAVAAGGTQGNAAAAASAAARPDRPRPGSGARKAGRGAPRRTAHCGSVVTDEPHVLAAEHVLRVTQLIGGAYHRNHGDDDLLVAPGEFPQRVGHRDPLRR